MNPAPTSESLLAHYKEGALVEAIVDRFDGSSEERRETTGKTRKA